MVPESGTSAWYHRQAALAGDRWRVRCFFSDDHPDGSAVTDPGDVLNLLDLDPRGSLEASARRARYAVFSEFLRAPGSRLLICTADLPWLTGEAVDAFIEGSSADLNYPIITKQIAQEQFPEQKRTWVRLKQGEFTGGNLALLSARAVPPLLQLVGRLFAARKNPLALGSLFGLGTIVALLRGQADLPKLEQQASELLGYPVRAVMARHAGLGADADKPEHLPRD